jgi:hypothetical protein
MEEAKAYRILLQMFEVIERTTHRPPRECFNQLVRYLADCVRINPLPRDEHYIGDRLLPLTVPWLEAFYKDPQDHLGTIFTDKGCANDKLGQLITPRSIVQVITQMAIGGDGTQSSEKEEQGWELVLDPCTGTGRFLVEAAVQFPYRKLVFYGVELDIDLYRAALVNMRLVAWHRPHYILCANTLIVDVAPRSSNWRYANQWHPPAWETTMTMENGQTWSVWCEERGHEVGDSPIPHRDPQAAEHQDRLQPRLL